MKCDNYYPEHDDVYHRQLTLNEGEANIIGLLFLLWFVLLLTCIARWSDVCFWLHNRRQRAYWDQETNQTIFNFLSRHDAAAPIGLESNTRKHKDQSVEVRKEILTEHFLSKGKRMEITAASLKLRNSETGKGSLKDIEEGLQVGDDGPERVLLGDDEKKGKKSAEGSCAICLEPYREGDFVLWSSFDECPHAYHENCIIDFLEIKARKNPSSIPCPCCRRNFCSFSDAEKELLVLIEIQ